MFWKLSFFIVYDRRIMLEELANELNNSKNIINKPIKKDSSKSKIKRFIF